MWGPDSQFSHYNMLVSVAEISGEHGKLWRIELVMRYGLV